MTGSIDVTLTLTPYERGRLAALLGRDNGDNPFPEIDDGKSDWAVWYDGYEHGADILTCSRKSGCAFSQNC